MSATGQNTALANMITGQIMTGHVIEQNVLDALVKVDRAMFMPEAFRNLAYIDGEIPLPSKSKEKRFVLEPLVFARMLKYAEIKSTETVLDTGCGFGYSSAVVAQLAQKVVALEEDETLALQAKTLLTSFSNVECVHAPLASGVSAKGPYDAIFIEGAIQTFPQALFDQLREGGRLLAIEHREHAKTASAGLGKLVEYRKINGSPYKTVLHDANSSLLPAFKTSRKFAF